MAHLWSNCQLRSRSSTHDPDAHVCEYSSKNPFILNKYKSSDGEPTSPHRTTLLKILDSYLLKTLATKSPVRRDNPQSDLNQTFLNISKELLSFSIELITYANASLKRSLDSSDGPAELPTTGEVDEEKTASMKPPRYYDTILPKVSESIILVVQSFCTLSLVKDTSGQISAFSQRTVSLLTEASLQQGQGLVEAFIGEYNSSMGVKEPNP